MAGGDGPGGARLQITGSEDLPDGQSLGGEVVVAESVGLVGVVEQYQPPVPAGWRRALGGDGKFGVRSPDWPEVVGDLLLERSHDRCDIRIGQHGALVDHRNLDGGGLSVRGLRHCSSLLETDSENAQRELRDSVRKSLYADRADTAVSAD